MFLKNIVLIFLLELVSGLYVDQSCKLNHDGSLGICKVEKQCHTVLIMLKCKRITPTLCGFKGSEPIVCCPTGTVNLTDCGAFERIVSTTEIPFNEQGVRYIDEYRSLSVPDSYSERISVKKCSEFNKDVLFDKTRIETRLSDGIISVSFMIPIVGGIAAPPSEYRHMAAVGWTLANGSGYSWNCGGSLISEYYVLTAAHCEHSRDAGFLSPKPIVIRLGDVNLEEVNENETQIIEIEKIILNPNYTGVLKYHDIALFRLKTGAKFTGSVKPTCLWPTEEILGGKPTVAGWGKTAYSGNSSNILLHTQVDIIDREVCKNSYDFKRSLPRGIINEQFCAGDSKGGKDTCQGDSGGPIQMKDANFKYISYIFGVTSFGAGCGNANSPGVYTKVSPYLGWIESVVWPN